MGLSERRTLDRQLEEALRAARRQAAPFSRGQPKPKPPGRKAGEEYARRHCRGPVELEQIASQYREDIVRRTLVRRFDVEVGRCRNCGRRVQGRHPLQTYDALGAAQVQLGPEALALAAHLRHEQLVRSSVLP
ncbi:MAG: hypothetical protein AAB225_10315 [Acidobacteriota bacterium]